MESDLTAQYVHGDAETLTESIFLNPDARD